MRCSHYTLFRLHSKTLLPGTKMFRFPSLWLLLANFSITVHSSILNITDYDIGYAHNEAFVELSEMYQDMADGTMEERDVVESVIALLQKRCDYGDKLCKSRSYKTTMNEFYGGKKMKQRNFSDTGMTRFPAMLDYLPEDFDPEMKEAIITVRQTLSLLKERSADEVIQDLYAIMGDIFIANPQNKIHQVIAIAATSMAIGSTQLWSRISFDRDSSLHKMSRGVNMCTSSDNRRRRRRRLEEGEEEESESNDDELEEEDGDGEESSFRKRLTRAVQADLDGAVRGAKDGLKNYIDSFNFVNLLTDPKMVISLMLETAIASSAAAFMDSGL